MNQVNDIVACNAERVSSLASEICDAETVRDALHALVRKIPECLTDGTSVDPAPLRQTGIDETLISKLLRTVLFEYIETFRRTLDPAILPDAVLALRACIDSAHARPPVNPEDRDFFRRLLALDCEGYAPDHRRLVHLFEDVVLTFHDIVYVHDMNGTMLYLNLPGLKATKFSAHDLQNGLSVYDLIAPEYTDLIEARIESPGAVSSMPYVSEIYTKDGERIPFEFTTRCIKREGCIVGVLGLARNLRLARRLESEIRRSNLYIDTVVAHAPIGIVIADSQCMIVDANPTAVSLFGATGPGVLMGNPLYGLFEEDPTALRELMFGVLSTGKEDRITLSCTTAFGATVNCDTSVVPLGQSEGGCVESLLVLMIDLTSQVELQRNLVQSEKLSAIGEIVAGVAHELNNPLTGILGYAQLLLTSQADPAIKTRLEHISAEAERCRRIVQNLLSFSRHYESEKALRDINDILSEVMLLREYQIRIDGIELEIVLAPDLPQVNVDSHELQRVFLNIINNAQQALSTIEDRARKLTITTFEKDHTVRVRFEDNGPGISETIRTRVFDPFFTTKGVGEGTGLGLSVSYGVVRDHGGRVDLESKEGEGSAFTVILPVPHSA